MPEDENVEGAINEAPVVDDGSPASGGEGDVAAELTSFLTERGESRETDDESTDDTLEIPTKDKEPVEEKEPKAKADKPDADKVPDAPVEEDDGDEDALLTKEQLDQKFPNASKPVREYADRVSRRLEAIEQGVNDLGGVEGLKKLAPINQILLSQPDLEGKSVETLLETVKKINPALDEALQTHIFYGAVDAQPQLLENLIAANMDKETPSGEKIHWTSEDLKVIAEARAQGHLDIDGLKELVGTVKLPDEVVKRLEAAESKGTKAEETLKKLEVTDYKKAVSDDIQLASQGFKAVAEPLLAKYGFTITKDDPEPVKQAKVWVNQRMDADIHRAMNANPVIRELMNQIKSQKKDEQSGSFTKGENFDINLHRASNAFKGIMRAAAIDWAPYLTSRIKALGVVGRNIEERDPLPEDSKDAGGKIDLTKQTIPANGDLGAELQAAIARRQKTRDRVAAAS